MERSIVKIFFIVTFLFLGSSIVKAQNIDPRYESIFVYQFTRYLKWPTNNGDFVIAVVGDSRTKRELMKMARTKKIGGVRKIVVKQYNSIAEIGECNIVFLRRAQTKLLPSLAKKMTNKSVLIITEAKGATRFGSHINFYSRESKVKFEINDVALKQKKIIVAERLKTLGVVVSK